MCAYFILTKENFLKNNKYFVIISIENKGKEGIKLMQDFLSIVGLFIGVLVLAAVLSALPVMLLWNALIPAIFGLTKITFWQALGLKMLCGLLFCRVQTSKD